MAVDLMNLSAGTSTSFTVPQLLLGLVTKQGSPTSILLSNGIIFEIQNLQTPVILLPPKFYTQFCNLKQNASDTTSNNNRNIRKSTGVVDTENGSLATHQVTKGSDEKGEYPTNETVSALCNDTLKNTKVTLSLTKKGMPVPVQLFTNINNDRNKDLSNQDGVSEITPIHQPVKSDNSRNSTLDLSTLIYSSRINEDLSTEQSVSLPITERTSLENDKSLQIESCPLGNRQTSSQGILSISKEDEDFGILQKLSERIMSDAYVPPPPDTVKTPVIKTPKKPPVRIIREEPEKMDFTCQICNKTLSRSSALELHLKIHSNVKDFVCSVCGKEFRWRQTYEAHMYVHRKGKPFKCPYKECENSYVYKNGLEHHMASKHNIGEQKIFKCNHTGCNKHFMSLTGLKSHEECIHNETREAFVCDVCGKSMARRTSLKVHMKIHNKVQGAEKKWLNCDKCEKRFMSYYTLRRHKLQVHLGTWEKKFQCTTCGKCYYTSSALRSHEIMHTDARPFQCKDCPRTFRSYTHLRGHKNMHLGIKPNKCAFCPKTFTFYANMLKHVKRHGNNRPFKCELCDRGFFERQELRKHMVSHQKFKASKVEPVLEDPDEPQLAAMALDPRDNDSLQGYNIL